MKGLRCLPGEQPGRGSLISERKELKAAPTFPPQLPDAAIRQHLAGFPLVQSRLEGKRSWPDPGSLVVVRLGELCLLRFHPPKQLLVFARELGVCSELAPCVCVCVGRCGRCGLWFSPGGLKSQLEEGGKRKIKAAQFLGPHVFSQACRSSSKACESAWQGCVRATRPLCTWRCCVGVCIQEGFIPGGHYKSLLRQQNLMYPLHSCMCWVLAGALQERTRPGTGPTCTI